MPPPRLLKKPSPYVPSPLYEGCYLLIYRLGSQADVTSADAKKDDHPRSPSLLSKLLAPFKNLEQKVKAPKSPKKEKKEEVKVLF
jgi:hypothetical protein